jgi:hypothetical protein
MSSKRPDRVSTLLNRSGHRGCPENGRQGDSLLREIGEIPDALFGWTMRLCGLAVVSLLGPDRV